MSRAVIGPFGHRLDLKMAIKAFKKMKSGTTTMKFVDLGSVDDWVLEGYGDAGFKSLPDKLSSCCGYVILLTNKKTEMSSILDYSILFSRWKKFPFMTPMD